LPYASADAAKLAALAVLLDMKRPVTNVAGQKTLGNWGKK
jgi:hypothetical protein